MDSSKPDREASSEPSDTQVRQNETNNPFVRFRHFADAQAGLVLKGMQSIIGLPSSLRREEPFDEKLRWTEWDEYMKRRDEAQAKQRHFTESEPHKSHDNDKQREIPNEDDSNDDVSSHCALSKEERAQLLMMDDEGESDGLELYMPVTKALFGHLIEELEERTWNSPFGAKSTHSLPRFMQFLKDDSNNLDHMPIVQAKIFERLNAAPCPIKKLSTIPYLMFSPYSPLALTFQMPVQSIGSKVQGEHEMFPYAAAFQDLLLISQGRDMKNLEDMALTRGMHNFWSSWDKEPGSEDLVGSAMSWLHQMSRIGLLWTRVDSSWFDYNTSSLNQRNLDTVESTRTTPDTSVDQQTRATREAEDTSSSSPSTELSLYEAFYNLINDNSLADGESYDTLEKKLRELRDKAFESAMKSAEAVEEDIRTAITRSRSTGTQTEEPSLVDSIVASTLGVLDELWQMVEGTQPKRENSSAEPQNVKDVKDLTQLFEAIDQAARAEISESGSEIAKALQLLHQNTTQQSEAGISNPQQTPLQSQTTKQSFPDGSSVTTTVKTFKDQSGLCTTTSWVEKKFPDGSHEITESSSSRSSMSDEDDGTVGKQQKKLEQMWERDMVRDSAYEDDVDEAEEVKAWEAEGKRIVEERKQKADKVQLARSRGKGWFWE